MDMKCLVLMVVTSLVCVCDAFEGTWLQNDNMFYYLSDETASFEVADLVCLALGGRLATMKTNDVRKFLARNNPEEDEFWLGIGLLRSDDWSTWIWSDDTTTSDLDWAPDFPDTTLLRSECLPTSNGQAKMMEFSPYNIHTTFARRSMKNDLRHSKHRFVCEFEADACDACADAGQQCFRRSRDCYVSGGGDVPTVTDNNDDLFPPARDDRTRRTHDEDLAQGFNFQHQFLPQPTTTKSTKSGTGNDVDTTSHQQQPFQWMFNVLIGLVVLLIVCLVVALFLLALCLYRKKCQKKEPHSEDDCFADDVTRSGTGDTNMQLLAPSKSVEASLSAEQYETSRHSLSRQPFVTSEESRHTIVSCGVGHSLPPSQQMT